MTVNSRARRWLGNNEEYMTEVARRGLLLQKGVCEQGEMMISAMTNFLGGVTKGNTAS